MEAGDYGEARSEPWTYRDRIVPSRTYCGRIVYRKKKHYFKIQDARRILAKLEPLEGDDPQKWSSIIIAALREATITMLQRILPFLGRSAVAAIYDWCIDLLDKFFQVDQPDEERETAARKIIIRLADRVGLAVTLKK